MEAAIKSLVDLIISNLVPIAVGLAATGGLLLLRKGVKLLEQVAAKTENKVDDEVVRIADAVVNEIEEQADKPK